MVRGALATLLALEADIEVVAQCSRGDEVVAAARSRAPRRRAARHRDARARRARRQPRSSIRRCPTCTIIILTTFGRPGYLRRAMEAGATGFVVKDGPADQLAVSIRRAVAGERVIDTALAAAALSDGSNPLTPRERDVLHAASGGATIATHRDLDVPVAGNGAQLPVVGDSEDRCTQSPRGGAHGRAARLAVAECRVGDRAGAGAPGQST